MTLIQPLSPTLAGGAATKAQGTLGHGAARVSIAERAGRSFLDERFFTDPYRLFTPRTAETEPVQIVLSTLSGGLVGGDVLSFDGAVKTGAAGQFVGQAAEKVYGSAGPTTNVGFSLSAEDGAWLEQVPQETILFDQARLNRRFDIKVSSGARALIGDMVVLGRIAMGEEFRDGAFADTWRLEIDGALVWCDRFGFEDAGIARAKSDPFGLGGALGFATVLYVGEDAQRVVELVRDEALIERAASLDLRLGATCLGTHTLVRVMGERPQSVRLVLGEIWKQLRADRGGFAPILPTLWTI